MWSVKVQEIVKAKQVAFKRLLGNPSGEDRGELLEQYKLAKKAAKQVVAKVKDGAFESLYKAIDEKGGERLLFCLAQDREKKSRVEILIGSGASRMRTVKC